VFKVWEIGFAVHRGQETKKATNARMQMMLQLEFTIMLEGNNRQVERLLVAFYTDLVCCYRTSQEGQRDGKRGIYPSALGVVTDNWGVFNNNMPKLRVILLDISRVTKREGEGLSRGQKQSPVPLVG
jgi:hypothetical protein